MQGERRRIAAEGRSGLVQDAFPAEVNEDWEYRNKGCVCVNC